MQFKYLPLLLGPMAVSGCAPSAPAVSGRTITPATAPSFSSQPLGFEVWLPAKPAESKQSKAMDQETITLSIFSASAPPMNYVVFAVPTPPSFKLSNVKKEMEALQAGFLNSSGATLQKSEDIQLGGFQGRDVTLSLGQGQATMRGRFYITPKFFYQILAGGPNAEVKTQSAQIDKVLNSFRILPQ